MSLRINMVLHEGLMLRTAHPDVYQELVENKHFFKHRIHLFTTALAIGVILNRKSSGKTLHHDLVRIAAIKDKEVKSMIDVLSRIACKGSDKLARGQELLEFADGGLEKLWEEYQDSSRLDLPRLVSQLKSKCSERIPELLENR